MDDALGFSFQRVTRRGPDLILDARKRINGDTHQWGQI
jgi:hypothetical protein